MDPFVSRPFDDNFFIHEVMKLCLNDFSFLNIRPFYFSFLFTEPKGAKILLKVLNFRFSILDAVENDLRLAVNGGQVAVHVSRHGRHSQQRHYFSNMAKS